MKQNRPGKLSVYKKKNYLSKLKRKKVSTLKSNKKT